MYSKFKVFLFIGCFLLVATTALAEPFWYFHTGHVIKYTRAKSDGTNWLVTMTIGAGGQNKCDRNDYYKVDEYNYDNLGGTDTKFLRVTENAGYQCENMPVVGDTEIKFFQTGPEGTSWNYGTDTDGVKFQVVNQTRYGSQYTIRRFEIEGGVSKPAVFNYFYKGFGLVKETDQWVDDLAPWTQVRNGYRGSTLYATFEGQGLYVYDYDGKSTWTRISSVPANMVTLGPNVYATWPGQGLYVWDGNVWTRIAATVPTTMVSANSKLYATWTGQGLYKWDGATWTRISSVPDTMVASGKYLYATWTGQGLYKWDGATWTRISSVPGNIIAGSLSGQ